MAGLLADLERIHDNDIAAPLVAQRGRLEGAAEVIDSAQVALAPRIHGIPAPVGASHLNGTDSQYAQAQLQRTGQACLRRRTRLAAARAQTAEDEVGIHGWLPRRQLSQDGMARVQGHAADLRRRAVQVLADECSCLSAYSDAISEQCAERRFIAGQLE